MQMIESVVCAPARASHALSKLPSDLCVKIFQFSGKHPEEMQLVSHSWFKMVTPEFLKRYFNMRVSLPVPNKYFPYVRTVDCSEPSQLYFPFSDLRAIYLNDILSATEAASLIKFARTRFNEKFEFKRLEVIVENDKEAEEVWALPVTSIFSTVPIRVHDGAALNTLREFVCVSSLPSETVLTLLEKCKITHLDVNIAPDHTWPEFTEALSTVQHVTFDIVTPGYDLRPLLAAIPTWTMETFTLPQLDDAVVASIVKVLPPTLKLLNVLDNIDPLTVEAILDLAGAYPDIVFNLGTSN